MSQSPQNLDERYSDIFHDLQDKHYYKIPKEKLNLVSYEELSAPPKTNIYVMRNFKDPDLSKLHKSDLTENQIYYANNGYLILRNFIPHSLINSYLKLRKSLDLGVGQLSGIMPHVRHREVLDIASYKPLMDVIKELHGMEMGLIFTLSGFKSTKRGWHQDAYLDDDTAIPRLASWVACGEVDSDCGPFQYIPGSHHWHALSNQKINKYLKRDYQWPHGHVSRKKGELGWGRISEAFIDPAVFDKLKASGHSVHEFTAQKGDVLLWYGRLMHRGSPARVKGRQRPGLIGHYAPLFERRRGYFAKRSNGVSFIAPPSSLPFLSNVRVPAKASKRDRLKQYLSYLNF